MKAHEPGLTDDIWLEHSGRTAPQRIAADKTLRERYIRIESLVASPHTVEKVAGSIRDAIQQCVQK